MKTKKLLLIVTLFSISLSSFSIGLLISEDFSSQSWADEIKRLNPTYVRPATNTTFFGVDSTPLYFGKYYLNGAIVIFDGISTGNLTNACPLFESEGIVHADTGGVAVAFRLRSGTVAPVTTTYLEFPKISSAGMITIHGRCGSTTASGTISIQKYENDAWVNVKNLTLAKSNNYNTVTVDEIKTWDLDIVDSTKLRICGGLKFAMLFRVDIAKHIKADLKISIDSATTIKTSNAGNIGTAVGQYPQADYDIFSEAIDSANVVFNNVAATEAEADAANLYMTSAITDFNASINDVGTGINTPKAITIKQSGRQLTLNETANIAIYNTVGTLVFKQDNVKVTEVPASVGKGIFLVKSGISIRKIYLNN